MLQPDEKGKYDMQGELARVMEKLFRTYKKSIGGGTLEIEEYQSDQKEFQSIVNCTIKVQPQKFPFEVDHSGLFFAAFGGTTDFDGITEIYKVGYDLNERYPASLLSAWYREDLVKRIQASIFSEENTPFVLVGKEGVGKKSILHESLYRYLRENEGTAPDLLQKVWYVDPTRVIAGMSIVGMWQKRFESILKYIKERRTYLKKVKDKASDKLFFDNAVALLRIGKSSQNNMTLSDVLKPYLEKRLIQVTLLATPEEWKVVQESDRRFADLFRVIRIDEPDMVTAVKMVLQRRKLLEVEYGNQISAHAIYKLFAIHRNYFKRSALPGGVMRLLNQMAIKYKFSKIDITEIEQEFEDFSGLKRSITDDTATFKEKDVRNAIAVKLVGQGAAVDALADTIHAIKAKLVNPSKPKGSFLFIGPTGVGKTQAAKVLSEFMLGGEEKLMRFDMNEFIDGSAVSRLIGDSNNPEGYLTGKVRYNPFGIVLLDEIEKAHPKVHDLLLQVLDDGRLTDSLGRTVDFSNTIIIMTSNIGADRVSSRLGFGHMQSEIDAVYRKAVENHFRPEFVNRIDKIVIFQPLQQQHILGIARLQINELLKRDGFVRRTTILNISEDALSWVSSRGFDEKMGGRALKRQIEKDLTALSAEQLLDADSETPVILDIYLENNKLVPRITALEFQETLDNDWLPHLPEEKKGKRFYGDLLRSIERIERNIQRYEDSQYDDNNEDDSIIIVGGESDDLDWQYYDFKDRLVSTKEKVKETMLGFRDNFFRGGPAIPLRLKGGGLGSYIQKSNASTKGYRQLLKDKLFQEQALSELNEFYRLASDQFNSLNTEFIDNYLDVAFLALHTKGFLKGNADEVEIKYTSCIDGKGRKETNYLMDLHKAYFKDTNIQFEVNEKANTIIAESHSLFELMKGERGIHLFYRTHQTPLPIRIEVNTIGKRNSLDGMNVIRLYDLKATLSDLRTGFSNDVQITPKEFKLILFAGLSPQFRNSLMR
jgi:ATP-dependent Clp protease ATP-binding subunit ClpC